MEEEKRVKDGLDSRMNEFNISVIIPVYNTAPEYLEACLMSLLPQCAMAGAEVIVVDDGSDNGCGKVPEGLRENYPCLRYIRQENQGTSVARNRGLEAAKGTYVLFVDGDDRVSPDCLIKVLNRMEEAPVDLLFFGYATSYENREVERVLPPSAGPGENPALWQKDALELTVLRGNPEFGPVEIGAPWGKLIRRKVITEKGLAFTPGLVKGQDTVFVLHLIENCETYAYYPYLGYHYRVSENSVSRRYNPGIVGIMEKTLSAYEAFAAKYGKGEEFREAVRRKYCRVLTGEYLELFFLHPENPLPGRRRLRDFHLLTLREPYRTAVEKAGPEGGLYDRTLMLFLKKKWIRPLFSLKTQEYRCRNLIVRKYR